MTGCRFLKIMEPIFVPLVVQNFLFPWGVAVADDGSTFISDAAHRYSSLTVEISLVHGVRKAPSGMN